MSGTSGRFAPAKINLFLHVGALATDGFHPLSSWMVFADVGDRVAATPAETLSLTIEGPFGAGLTAGADNLVVRAARGLLDAGSPGRAAALVLTKALPLAAGLGGGSSDAGATLLLLRDLLDIDVDDAGLEAVAGALGADGPACLRGVPVIAEGRGERLIPAPSTPVLHAVLVNPGVDSPTGAVYRGYDISGAPGSAERPDLPEAFDNVQATVAFLADCRNDLEPPAVVLTPAIGEVLAVLRDQPQTLLARVSGSGATCFSLCADASAAQALALRLRTSHPEWWVKPCRLGGPWSRGA